MKKFTLFLAALLVAISAMAQTVIFKETFGDVGNKDNKYYADQYTGWDNPGCTFTGQNVSIRMTSALNTHAWFPKGKTSFINIAGITGGKNLSIGFDFAANKGGLTTDELSVTVNGVKVNIPATTAAKQNEFVTVAPVAIADADILEIRISDAAGMPTEGVRVDNIVVYAGEAAAVAVEAPQFSVAAGSKEEAFNLELTCATEGADIYYTLNGGADTKYESAIRIEKTTTVKAWAVKGADKSREVSATYTFMEYVENATIEQLLNAEVADNVWYQLTGTITSFRDAENALVYGNFTLEDETASVLVYGLTATKQSYNDKSFSSLGLKVGDKITIWGTRSDYKGDAQVGGPAYFVKKHSGETVSVDDVEVNDIYVMNRMVVADGEFSIFTIAGQNVTAMNGTLANGVYIVKTTNSAVKVVVK
jgi:hypothetical protein